MKKERVNITITFSVNKEMVPGVFYDPMDFVDVAYRQIAYMFQAYDPKMGTGGILEVHDDSE